MHPLPPIPLLVLWSLWLLQAILSAAQVRRFSRLFAPPPANKPPTYRDEILATWRPPAWVIVPFKGVDAKLAETVRGLFEQDYPDYRLVLVVDSPDDPAVPVLRDAISAHPGRPAELLIAGPAGLREGQKIHNQLFAIDHIAARSADEHVWAFADSDAVVGPGWLAAMVGPLGWRNSNAMTTGYRWLIPEGEPGAAASRPTHWSHLASIINSSVACFLARQRYHQAWGGSMAVLVGTAKRGHLRDRLVGALTDDYQFTKMSHDLGLRVYFVPRCLVPTPVHFTLSSLINFAHRQYLITRVYRPYQYWAGLVIVTLYVTGIVSALTWLTLALVHGTGQWKWPLLFMECVFIADQVRGYFRAVAVRRAFGDAMRCQLKSTLLWDRYATFLWLPFNWLMLLRAAIGNTMTWRGITYRLHGPQNVERL